MQATDRGLSVFRHYLPVQFRIGKKFLNPLYKDTKASCNVYYDRRHSVYKMKDFGNEEYSGDCFELVGHFLRSGGLSAHAGTGNKENTPVQYRSKDIQ